MASCWAAGLVLAVLAGTARDVGAQADSGASSPEQSVAPKRLGRTYPAPVPPRSASRDQPGASVSLISPRESRVHQKAGRQRSQHQAGSGAVDGESPAGSSPSEPVVP